MINVNELRQAISEAIEVYDKEIDRLVVKVNDATTKALYAYKRGDVRNYNRRLNEIRGINAEMEQLNAELDSMKVAYYGI